ncbi:ornithine carbamoyltransferase [Streptomyces cupreus]|uniref:Ornithine carbamoyltransferase n=1 Tax=Streptomyces cupreus TaxID=2759956 RepID=A0A7X1JD34_9ACTN|nr:ornithine carbamoyltransferase [Streptomyces cupreus]MBC2905937.1 ornithine carbamoyltransferase [Streptomyces cupreus]
MAEKKQLLTIEDLSATDVRDIVAVADALERHVRKSGHLPALLRGKCLGMIFDETSLRTRTAFERAIGDLGGQAIHYNGAEARVGRHAAKTEHLPDFVNVAGGFNDVLLSRIYDYATQEQICELSPVPFINGMCDEHHPTQALCDFLTIKRQFGAMEGIDIAFVGDGTNIALSLAQTAAKVGARLTCATPERMALPAERTAHLAGFTATTDPEAAVKDAHVVVADAWIPMNKAHEAEQRREILAPYRVTPALMSLARPDAVFLHNLPAYRGDEVVPEVIDGPQSVVYPEAVARLHIARALLLFCLRPDWAELVAATEADFDSRLGELS